MTLPNGEAAVVDVRKLREYCLSLTHKYGKHKATLFASAFGITLRETELLRTALLTAAKDRDATPTRHNGFGQLYELKFDMIGPRGSGTLLSVWIVLATEDIPRLVTCYPL